VPLKFLYRCRNIEHMKCPCCGGEMAESEKEKVILFKCKECGLSNNQLK